MEVKVNIHTIQYNEYGERNDIETKATGTLYNKNDHTYVIYKEKEAVVINRIKDSRFPNTLEGVIYQKNAFSVVKDGNINAEPTSSTYRAAQEALYGNDPTDNAIYFWNPDISTCKWINTLNPYLRIGNHVFAK